MKLFAPAYYKNFKCNADKCTHTCCVGWEIDIDPDTLEKYSTLATGYGRCVRESLAFDGTPHFALTEGERCPHLDEKGLCRIITELGEEYLCDICREHPRFYNLTARGMEVGLGMACEEAARLILSSDSYADILEIGKEKGRAHRSFDAVSEREKIYALLSDRTTPYKTRLERLRSQYGIREFKERDSLSEDIISSLEYLDPQHKELFLASLRAPRATDGENEKYLERALAYFVYRHLSPSRTEIEAHQALSLALFLEELLARLFSFAKESEPATLARIISEEIEYSEDNTEKIKTTLSR